MDVGHFIQDQHHTTSICYTLIAKLLLKNANIYNFVKKRIKQRSEGHDLSAIHLNDSTLFASIYEDV